MKYNTKLESIPETPSPTSHISASIKGCPAVNPIGESAAQNPARGSSSVSWLYFPLRPPGDFIIEERTGGAGIELPGVGSRFHDHPKHHFSLDLAFRGAEPEGSPLFFSLRKFAMYPSGMYWCGSSPSIPSTRTLRSPAAVFWRDQTEETIPDSVSNIRQAHALRRFTSRTPPHPAPAIY